MSTISQAEVPAGATGDREPAAYVRGNLRFFLNELRLVFFRRRNQLLLVVTVVFPIVIGIALRVAAPPRGCGAATPAVNDDRMSSRTISCRTRSTYCGSVMWFAANSALNAVRSNTPPARRNIGS